MTRSDLIRSLPDKELVTFIRDNMLLGCQECPLMVNLCMDMPDATCEEVWKKWLQQEVDNDA